LILIMNNPLKLQFIPKTAVDKRVQRAAKPDRNGDVRAAGRRVNRAVCLAALR
jgi:hypothetical protein